MRFATGIALCAMAAVMFVREAALLRSRKKLVPKITARGQITMRSSRRVAYRQAAVNGAWMIVVILAAWQLV